MHARVGLIAAVGIGALTTVLVRANETNKTTPEEMSKLSSKIRSVDTPGWAKIPWVGSLVEARKLSKQENAPIFLFVHDGNISTGRC